MALHRQASGDRAEETVDVRPHLAPLGEEVVVPRFRMPQESTAPETAYQIVHDELMLDGKARLNMATFVTTWMDSYADRLMAECAPKNMIDKDEYPQTAALE
ncbi:glutamate decarboxylase, partial [Frankia casuarinae]